MQSSRNILSIDGGGIKGVLPAAFLAAVEEATGKRIVDHFDLIVGTSTGGIIALGLGLGMSAKDVLSFYELEGPHIFAQGHINGGWREMLAGWISGRMRGARQMVMPKYNAVALRQALERALGDKKLGDSTTRLVIPAFDRERREVHVFKTSHHERFMVDWKECAVNVALATAAAPTYLPGHRLDNGISLLDGGIWANNPVGAAVVEAIGVLGWPAQQLHVLSLGCSDAPMCIPENAGLLGLALKVADIFMVGQSSASVGTAKLLLGEDGGRKRFHRYQPTVPEGTFGLDVVKQIPALKGIGSSLARDALPTISSTFLVNVREAFRPAHFGSRPGPGQQNTAPTRNSQ